MAFVNTSEQFDKLWKTRDPLEFQMKMLGPIIGFEDIDAVRDEISAMKYMHNIKNTPMLIFLPDNDPLIEGTIDEDKLLENPMILLGKTKNGGHLAYLESPFSTH